MKPITQLRPFVPTLLLLACLASPVHAMDRYLAPGEPDAITLLAPPPEADSEQEAAELQMSRELFKARTPEQTARARADAVLTISYFTNAVGAILQPGKLPKTEALFAQIKKEMKPVVTKPKDFWKRKRPCQIDPGLEFDEKETSFGYPSGHSTVGTVEALVLAELFPDKRKEVLAIGRQIGWDRVMTGYHFISDIEGGRVLGQAIVKEMMTSPKFQHDLAEAKAEIAAQTH